MEWTKQRPTTEGLYVHEEEHKITRRFYTVKRGRWQKAENPDWLYARNIVNNDVVALDKAPRGWWLGPLPECPRHEQ